MLGTVVAHASAGPVLDDIRNRRQDRHRPSGVVGSVLVRRRIGKPVGYAVDLCRRVAEAVRTKLGLKALAVEYLKVTPADRIAAIVDRRADLECGSTTNNAERRQKVAFTVPHFVTGARYLVRADSPIAELQEFRGKKLVSTTGTTPLKAITSANQERLLGITVVEAPDHARAVEMVEKGEADGFAMDDVLLYGLRAGRPDPSRLKVVGKFLAVEALAIMLSQGRPGVQADRRRRDEAAGGQPRGELALRPLVHRADSAEERAAQHPDELSAEGPLEVPDRLGSGLGRGGGFRRPRRASPRSRPRRARR